MIIGERGQITIPKELRDKYGLLPKMEVELVPTANGIILKKRTNRQNPFDEVYGILNNKQAIDKIIKRIRGV